jgi:Zn-dependent protease
MRRSGIKIGRIFGIPIYLHLSWILIFGLITYSLVDEFGARYPQWSSRQLWSLGVLTSLLFFGSVLFHELSHSVVARYYRIPVASITLFFFGGVPDGSGWAGIELRARGCVLAPGASHSGRQHA